MMMSRSASRQHLHRPLRVERAIGVAYAEAVEDPGQKLHAGGGREQQDRGFL